MAYPNHVQIEFCHRSHVWRAFDGRKIVAYHPEEDGIKSITPNYLKIPHHETRVKDGQKVRCVCRCE